MNHKKTLPFVPLVLIVTATYLGGCTSLNENRSVAAINSPGTLVKPVNENICTITDSAEHFMGEDVTVVGSVMGYHHLIISDHGCFTPGNSLLVGLSPALHSQVFDPKNNYNGNSGNLEFIAKLSGNLRLRDKNRPFALCSADVDLVSNEIKYCIEVERAEILKQFGD